MRHVNIRIFGLSIISSLLMYGISEQVFNDSANSKAKSATDALWLSSSGAPGRAKTHGNQLQAGSMISVDFTALVSKADLDFKEPLGGQDTERGLPVGNGRMGTLLWTAPEQSKLHMQVNHTDVFAFRNSSASTHRDRGLSEIGRAHV